MKVRYQVKNAVKNATRPGIERSDLSPRSALWEYKGGFWCQKHHICLDQFSVPEVSEPLNCKMSDAAVAPAAAVPASAAPKKPAAKRVKKGPAKPRSHPPAAEMVVAAIKALKDRKGSSLQAIKKYIAGHYKVDVAKQSAFIKKSLKSAVIKKTIVQTKGSGASGRFRLGAKTEAEKKKKVVKKPAAKKAAAGTKKPATKKPKKPSAAKKPAGATTGVKKVKKPAAAKKPKSPKKPKAPKVKKAKAPAKPKVAKPKKAAAPKAAKK